MREVDASLQAAGRMPKRALKKGDFGMRWALMLPDAARYDVILAHPKGSNFGELLVKAMDAVEDAFDPLKGQLPRDYERFESGLLEDLLRTFDTAELR